MSNDFDNARLFASLMDQSRYKEAGAFIHSECEYHYQDKVINGVDAILKTYTENLVSGQKLLDELIFTSEVLPTVDPHIFKLKYFDKIRKNDSWFEHKCEQDIQFNNEGLIIRITHIDLPGEPEKLKAWYEKMGIQR